MTKKKQPPTPPSEGLGDTVEKITRKTGIKKAAKWFSDKTGIDCGCEERRAKLNALIRYRRTINCMTLAQYDRWAKERSAILKQVKANGTITPEQLQAVYNIHKALFGYPLEFPCPSCKGSLQLWLTMVKQVETVWLSFNTTKG